MDVLSLYRETGAYLEGHFLLASGRHSEAFLQSTTLFQFPQHVEAVGAALAEKFAGVRAAFVIGPAMGGVVLAHTVARALGTRALFAEKDNHGQMMLRDAFEIVRGEQFIAVEDVMTTGGSLKKAIAAAEARGGVCVGVGCVIDRGLAEFSGGLEPRSLARLDISTYPPDNCPLCDQNIPLEDV